MAVGWSRVNTLSFPVRSHEDSEGEWNLRFPSLHSTFGTITLRPHFTPKAILWYTFLLDAAWKPTKNFHGPYRKSNPEPPVLWRAGANAPARKLSANPFSLNLCTGRPLTESDDTSCCINTIKHPDDEHKMLETCSGL